MPNYYGIITTELTLVEQVNGDLLLTKGGNNVTIPADMVDSSGGSPGYVAAAPGTSDSAVYKWLKKFWSKIL